MRLELSMGIYQRQEQKLDQRQSLGLKNLLQLSQHLESPRHPDAARGMEGMRIADGILKNRVAIGILIGGLSASLWKDGVHLNRHKDVDVMVATDDPQIERFEGGVDWWLPAVEKFDVQYPGSTVENATCKWWANGNEVVLHFGIHLKESLPPGLYIPTEDWHVTMKTAEAISRIDSSIEGVIDDDVIEEFQKKIREDMENSLHSDAREFRGKVVDDKQVDILLSELPIVRAIKRRYKSGK